MYSIYAIKRILKSKGKLVKAGLITGLIFFLIYHSRWNQNGSEIHGLSEHAATGLNSKHNSIASSENKELLAAIKLKLGGNGDISVNEVKPDLPTSDGVTNDFSSSATSLGKLLEEQEISLWSSKSEKKNSEKSDIENLPIYADVDDGTAKVVGLGDDSVPESSPKSGEVTDEKSDNVDHTPKIVRNTQFEQKSVQTGPKPNNARKYKAINPRDDLDNNPPNQALKSEKVLDKITSQSSWSYEPFKEIPLSSKRFAIAVENDGCQALITFQRLRDLQTPHSIDLVVIDSDQTKTDKDTNSKLDALGVKFLVSMASLSKYSKVMQLGKDIFVIKRIDDLFLLPGSAKARNGKVDIFDMELGEGLDEMILPEYMVTPLSAWDDNSFPNLNDLASRVYITFGVSQKSGEAHPFVKFVENLHEDLRENLC